MSADIIDISNPLNLPSSCNTANGVYVIFGNHRIGDRFQCGVGPLMEITRVREDGQYEAREVAPR